MGGKALKNCTTRRFDSAEYFVIAEKVVKILQDELTVPWHTREIEVVKSYRNKPSHGDLDVIVSSEHLPANWVELVTAAFNSKEVVRNGDVTSFEYDEFQVDVIMTNPETFKEACHYFAYNDLGNLMGKLTRALGVKYGHDGLWYTYVDGTESIGSIKLAYDPVVVFDLLGLDYTRWLDGFDDLEDIFEYVATSKYFTPKVYQLAELNHAGRTRDKKRDTYNKFLAWCEGWTGPVYEFETDKAKYLPMLFAEFNGGAFWCNFREDWFALRHKMLDKRLYANKFNGHFVSRLTGLCNAPLGEFMVKIKPVMTRTFVLTQSEETIAAKVRELFEKG